MAKIAFGMRVLALSRDPSRRIDEGYCPAGTGDPDGLLPDEWLPRAGLMDLLERSDAVVMAAPLTAETRSMLGAAQFARMGPGAGQIVGCEAKEARLRARQRRQFGRRSRFEASAPQSFSTVVHLHLVPRLLWIESSIGRQFFSL